MSCADAAAVLPEVARQAGVTGVVILEVTIGADGTVTDARILRSIPLLDKAALDAVRQWRYEPTLRNGAPVPVILTVTVAFEVKPGPDATPSRRAQPAGLGCRGPRG